MDYPGRFVIAEGLTESARENLNQALEASNLLMIERHGNELRLLGRSTRPIRTRLKQFWALEKLFRPPPSERSWT